MFFFIFSITIIFYRFHAFFDEFVQLPPLYFFMSSSASQHWSVFLFLSPCLSMFLFLFSSILVTVFVYVSLCLSSNLFLSYFLILSFLFICTLKVFLLLLLPYRRDFLFVSPSPWHWVSWEWRKKMLLSKSYPPSKHLDVPTIFVVTKQVCLF